MICPHTDEYDPSWEEYEQFQKDWNDFPQYMPDEEFQEWLDKRRLGSLDLLIGEYYD